GEWIEAVALPALTAAAEKICASPDIPESFRVEASLGKLSLVSSPSPSTSEEPLATMPVEVPGLRGDLNLDIRVRLADSARFYSEQRARTLRFAALIA